MAGSKRRRQQQKARRRWPITRQGWINRWRKSMLRIRDRVTELWVDREVYRRYREIIESNSALPKNNLFFSTLRNMYVSHVAMALRTFGDTDLRSYSLHNLIEEIHDHANQITRARFVRRWPTQQRAIGENIFRSNWGRHRLNKTWLKRDIKALLSHYRIVKRLADKFVAHDDRRKARKLPTYKQLDSALDNIFEMVSRYCTLLLGHAWGTPNMQKWTGVFERPWLAIETER